MTGLLLLPPYPVLVTYPDGDRKQRYAVVMDPEQGAVVVSEHEASAPPGPFLPGGHYRWVPPEAWSFQTTPLPISSPVRCPDSIKVEPWLG